MRRLIFDTLNPRPVEFEQPDHWPDGEFDLFLASNALILVIPYDQIQTDYLKGFFETELMIFASKHSSAAEKKSLTVHTTGIIGPKRFDGRDHGGNDFELAYAPSYYLRKAYDKILELHKNHPTLQEYWAGIEVTHHGPSALDIPTIYVEVGGTEKEWANQDACDLIAEVVLYLVDLVVNPVDTDVLSIYKTFVGLGGTHYGPRFMQILEYYPDQSWGHIAAKYAHDHVDEDMLLQMWEKTMAKDKYFLLDKKGMRADKRHEVTAILDKHGIPWELAKRKKN